MIRTCILLFLAAAALSAQQTQPAIVIDYPLSGSVFPPEITAPTFLWRDPPAGVSEWQIEIRFADGSEALRIRSQGERYKQGEIDPRCVSATNELPKLTAVQAEQHTWTPEPAVWERIKKHSAGRPAVLTIRGGGRSLPASISFSTSPDPAGAPIFYRDVPLMPSVGEKNVIKPLAPGAIPLIQWRLRDLRSPRSRVVLEGIHTCANCHSFSRDGKTMGMDMDGPQNDKGLYALAAVKPAMSIRDEDMVTWNPSGERQVGLNRVGFMSQVSPDGRYVLTTVTPEDRPAQANFFAVNFKDYRILQVFYPTRGILGWYSRATGERKPLPGADDPQFVQTDGVWSPDGKYVIFARAEARAPFPPDGKMPARANGPEEVQIRYDLHRVPFNDGRGGRAEPITGASANGMSNTFPRVSPDGRWIVFVRCRNGQLMRPDSRLYIVPFEGGEAREMRCNTPLMNSWHSFSPNGRWMVFASKGRSPYTQMCLTHIDADGNDSPAILIENSTAANRAVNLPEFVNIPPDGLQAIATPAVDLYRKFDEAVELGEKGQLDAAIALWSEVLKASPDNSQAQNNLGTVLARSGRIGEAAGHYRRALELNPQFVSAHANLGRALTLTGHPADAISHLRFALDVHSDSAELHLTLGKALAMTEKADEAADEFRRVIAIDPAFHEARYLLGMTLYYSRRSAAEALAQWHALLKANPNFVPALDAAARVLSVSPAVSERDGAVAVIFAERAVRLSGGSEPALVDTLASAYAEAGRFREAVETARRALELAVAQNNAELAEALRARLALYESGRPYREAPRP